MHDKQETYQAFKGIILHSIDEKQIEIFNPGVLIVNSAGKINEICHKIDFSKYSNIIIHDFSNKLICPGFIDLHVHLPQYPIVGLGANELLSWLDALTFPMEKRFADNDFARYAIGIFFNEMLAHGTTLAAVYPTMHKDVCDHAFGYAAHNGIRLIMGKVLMDRNAIRELCDDTLKAIEDSEELLLKWNHFDNGRLRYAVTPRFAISCSPQLLDKAGQLAEKYQCYIQTHLAENPNEIEETLKLFSKNINYTSVYNNYGLLTDKSLLAHCIYLNADERHLIREKKAIAVHCATSNRFLQSGIFPLRKNMNDGLKISLGTDVAGGYELSMLSEMKEAIEMSKIYNIQHRSELLSPLTIEEVFFMSTLGAASSLGLDDQFGNFAQGKDADLIIMDDTELNPFNACDFFQEPIHRLSRMIYRGKKSVVQAVFIRGKRLK